MGYAGKGHTLDLHRKLPYDSVHDFGAESPEAEKAKFLETAKNFDVFLTAMDFTTAEWAREAGLKVIIYDALAWYWKEVPPITRRERATTSGVTGKPIRRASAGVSASSNTAAT